MSNDLTKKSSVELDGFAGYTDAVEGGGWDGGERVNRSVILGSRIKFIDGKWIIHPEGVVLPHGTKLVVMNIKRIWNKWGKDTEKGPLETHELGPKEPYPDFKALNAKAPRDEWIPGFNGELQGPYQGQRVVYFLDWEKTMQRYTWIDNLTVGGSIAVGDLVDQVVLMRLRRPNVRPVIGLSDAHMPTKYSPSGRRRPNLPVVDWIVLGEESPPLAPGGGGGQLPPAEEQEPAPSEQGAKPVEAPTGKVTKIKKPSAKEIVDDEIKY
jgi:hypothetical protein